MDGSGRRPWRGARVAAPLVAAVCLALVAPGTARADTRDDQRRVNAELARAQSVMEAATARAQRAARQYAQAAAALPAAQDRSARAQGVAIAAGAEARAAQRREQAALTALAAADTRHARAVAQVDTQREVVQSFAVAAYKGSGLVTLSAIAESGSPATLLDRLGYLEEVSHAQRNALNGFTTARQVARQAQNDARAAQQRATAVRRDADAALGQARAAQDAAQLAADEVTALVAQRKAAKATADSERAASLARYRELQAESARIAAQIRAEAARERQRAGRAATTVSNPPRGTGGYFLTPVRGYKSSDFGMRYDPYYRVWQLHAGVDLAAPGGSPIWAAGSGRVIRAGWNGGYGNYTCIYHGLYHGKGLATCYAHQSRILVGVGQHVSRGQLIGRVGTTGASTGYHLHFEVRLDGVPVQPLDWLNACLC